MLKQYVDQILATLDVSASKEQIEKVKEIMRLYARDKGLKCIKKATKKVFYSIHRVVEDDGSSDDFHDINGH